MSKQRPNLAEIAAAAGSTRKPQSNDSAPVAEQAIPKDLAAAAGGQKNAASRTAGTKQIAGHFPAEVSWQLRELALERRATVQALLGEALNDLFQKHGKPEIVRL